MKYIVLFIFIVLSLNANTKKQTLTVGLGPYIQTQPYKGVEDIYVPSPVVFYDNSVFYVRWTRVGVYFLGKKGKKFSWGLSLTTQPRTFGYKAKNSSFLKGMKERKTSLEGGVAFSAVYKDVNIEVMALTDIINNPDLWILSTYIGYKYKASNFTFYPSVGVTYESKNFVNYYYGVKTSEATINRLQYTPSDGAQLTAQVYINYALTDKFDILFNAREDYIPKSAQKSPIIESNYIYSGLISLMYTFDY